MQERLIEYLKKTPRFYLLFSGGFDSSALLGCAVAAGVEVMPVWIDNGFNRAREAQIRQQAANLGCDRLEVIKMVPDGVVSGNPVDRCYYCKGQIVRPIVGRKDAPVFDGTNSSDQGNYRPGLKAIREGNVRSPLADLGVSADQTRQIALELGADEAIAQMESCLATRFRYNLTISNEKIEVIREIEQQIVAVTGDYHVRCRLDDEDHLRIECRNQSTFLHLVDPLFRAKVVEIGKKIATFVTLDLEGARKNAYDKLLGL
jgi:uncharacterized protein